jgi:CubicO group peptidase (beta-lactamase class C family)
MDRRTFLTALSLGSGTLFSLSVAERSVGFARNMWRTYNDSVPNPEINRAPTLDRLLITSRPEDAGMSGPVLRAAVSLYSEAVARRDILGAVLLVARHGKVVVHEAAGVRDRERNLPMEKNTAFQIQSMIKPVVASAALILTADGRLQLDAPVSRYIPAFAHGRSQEIKIRNLLNHTSGFRIPSNFAPKTNAEIPDGSTLQREVARLPEIGPAEVPGSSYEYSNPGYNTLAAVIELASGKTIDAFLSDSIFKPLGMNNTYAYWRGLPRKGLPPVYEEKDGAWEIAHEDEPPFARGSGGFVSNAWDYAKFCQMYLNHGIYNGVRVMDESSVLQATSVTVRSPLVYPSPSQLQQRQMQPRWYYRRDSRGLGIDIGYGLGWVISSDGTFLHAGSWGTFCWVDPNREMVGLILTQNVGGRNPGIEFINVVNAAILDVSNHDSH